MDFAAMTLTNASPLSKGRPVKFTPQAIEKIKDLMAQGASRDEIANLLEVTVGSLQVTCSRLGISLRRNSLRNGSAQHTLDGRGIPILGAVGIASVREQKTEEVSQTAVEAAPLPKIAIRMRYRGNEVTTDVPLTSDAISALALDAVSRDLGIAELVGQILAAALKKDMIEKILRDEAPAA
jgi:hypothetical protein